MLRRRDVRLRLRRTPTTRPAQQGPATRQGGDADGVANVARFERFFRAAANLDVDKDDLKRYNDFVTDKIYDDRGG